MRWVRLDIPCRDHDADTVAAMVLMETGRGASVLRDGDSVVVQAWMPEATSAEVREALAARLDAADPPLKKAVAGTTATVIPETDWQFTWRNHYRPIRVGEKLVVKPSWEPWPPTDQPEAARPGDIIIEIDPGSAFGTGSHPTTQLALAALEKHVEPGATVLDVGCGSGILCLGALVLGAGKVVGVDIDEGSVACARRNLCEYIEAGRVDITHHDGATGLQVDADVVVANINIEGAVTVGRLAFPLLRPGGHYIATGLIENNVGRVLDGLADTGLVHDHTDLYDGWGCVVFVRPRE